MSSTYSSLHSQGTKAGSKLTTVALAGIAYFVVIIVVLHFLRPDVHPISRPTSEYAVGAYGYLMTSAFFSMSLASWALIIALYQGVPTPDAISDGIEYVGNMGSRAPHCHAFSDRSRWSATDHSGNYPCDQWSIDISKPDNRRNSSLMAFQASYRMAILPSSCNEFVSCSPFGVHCFPCRKGYRIGLSGPHSENCSVYVCDLVRSYSDAASFPRH